MNIYDFITAQHNLVLQKVDLIRSLHISDKVSRDIFVKDLYESLENLFRTEQISFYPPLLESKQYGDITETALMQQRNILNSIQMIPHLSQEEFMQTLLRTLAILNAYNSNQQLFLFTVLRNQLAPDVAVRLGTFAMQFHTELTIGKDLQTAYDVCSHLMPSTFSTKSRGHIKAMANQVRQA
ncbi:hypothetical protein DOM22_11815 [Bdellovibrio sp. ZAP7]|uniref:hypothetical protein n=1 Tax=Bdellovibrio sp. ZAP7 TaxID=2231053 RepID=UPI00115AF5AD|nr:hypothetical protein [Bdellovibrio sp. ZAP7]QDK45784.1 hypothetical protein DOM22_11815 [Bdellovibrio sp. ZAP7]